MISVEFASFIPHAFLANSTTASCIPKQSPRNGILCSRAYLMHSIFPSVPRAPYPPGTIIPSHSATSEIFDLSVSIAVVSIHFSFTEQPSLPPEWTSASFIETYESFRAVYFPVIPITTSFFGFLIPSTIAFHFPRPSPSSLRPSFFEMISESPCFSNTSGTS
ncbi:Uncharacterised protein [uncultured archaeon]|nr:Uncharacterised protein [uncultured archaeon]